MKRLYFRMLLVFLVFAAIASVFLFLLYQEGKRRGGEETYCEYLSEKDGAKPSFFILRVTDYFRVRIAYNNYMQLIRKVIEKGKRTLSYLSSKKYTTVAGTLAFFFMMSIVPFVFWLTLLFGNLKIDYEQLFELSVCSGIRDVLSYFLEAAQSATAGASVVLAATTLYSSTTLFYHMRRSGEIIYDYRRRKSGILVRLSALFLMFVILLLLFAEIGIFIFLGNFIRRIFHTVFAQIAAYILLGALAFLLILILNLYVCPYRVLLRDVVWGSLLTVLLGGVASFGFSLYLSFGTMEKLYGAVTLLIVFFLWVYLLMICFVMGVIVNCHGLEKLGKNAVPAKKF